MCELLEILLVVSGGLGPNPCPEDRLDCQGYIRVHGHGFQNCLHYKVGHSALALPIEFPAPCHRCGAGVSSGCHWRCVGGRCHRLVPALGALRLVVLESRSIYSYLPPAMTIFPPIGYRHRTRASLLNGSTTAGPS